MSNAYDVINRGLLAGVEAQTVTPEEARLASMWLDTVESTLDLLDGSR